MSKKYPIFRPTYVVDEVLNEIKTCLESGWTGLGGKTLEFEDRWKRDVGLHYAHFVNSSTSGLHLTLEVFKRLYTWYDGDEVITTPFTFISTNHVILHAKLTPVFADIDETLCLDPQSVLSKITNKTRAIMYVGIGGSFGRLDEIRKIAKDHGLRLILDAAHMAGSVEEATALPAGHLVDASVFSFQAVKNLNTCDSGMVCFSTKEEDALARKLSWLGIDKDTYTRNSDRYSWEYDVDEVGYKYHGNAVVAAIGMVQLTYLTFNNYERNRVALGYDKFLNNNVKRVVHYNTFRSSRHLYQILAENRDELLTNLAKEGISCGVHYKCNSRYPMYSHMQDSVPRSNYFSDRVLSLPMTLDLEVADIFYISEMVNKYYA